MRTLITTLFVFIAINAFTQDKKGTIFYSTVEQTETTYNINIDIFELYGTEYIEVELLDENDVKIESKMATLRFRNKKFYLTVDENKQEDGEEEKEKKVEEEKEVTIQDINLSIKNPDNNMKYPKVKVKLLDQNFSVVDFSVKVFY